MKIKIAQFAAINAILLFILACPNGAPETSICAGGTTKERLSIMTYNLHLFDIASAVTRVPFLKTFLQDLVDTYLTSTDSKLADFRDFERIKIIADRILELDDKPDLIIFTELWSGDLAHELEDRLRETYPFQYHPDADQYIFDGKLFGNGLALFSKYPVIPGSERFIPFAKLVGFDDFTVKGVGQATIQVCNGPQIGVFLTHTQAVYPDIANASQISFENVMQLSGVVNNYQSSHPEHAIIIAGDLNVAENSASYSQMIASLQAIDAYRMFYPDQSQYPGFTYDAKINALIQLFTEVNPTAPDRERLDYVFYRANGSISGVSTAIDGNPDGQPLGDSFKSIFEFIDPVSSARLPLSDHYPVRVDFALRTS